MDRATDPGRDRDDDDDGGGWTVVSPRNKRTPKKKRFTRREPPRKVNPGFALYDAEGPIDKTKAVQIQKDLNVDGLAGILQGDENQKLLKDGWRFYGIVRGGDPSETPTNTEFWEFRTYDLTNRWNDVVVVARPVAFVKRDWRDIVRDHEDEDGDGDDTQIWAEFEDDR